MTDSSRTGRNGLLRREQVLFNQKPAAVPVGALPQRKRHSAAGDAPGEPEVRVTKAQDGTIEQITVRCPCGREITLQCEYLSRGDHNAKQSP